MKGRRNAYIKRKSGKHILDIHAYTLCRTQEKKIDINVFISVLVLQQRKKNVIHDHGIKGTFVYTLIEHE